MKKLLIVLLALGSTSVFAEEFSNPTLKGNLISASSNKNAVCKLLTGNAAAESLNHVKDQVLGGRYGIVVVNKNNSRVKGLQVYQGFEKVISHITCVE